MSPESSPVPWHRVHPLTPYIRGWAVLVVVIAAFLRIWVDNVVSEGGSLPGQAVLIWTLLATLGLAVVVVACCWVSWRYMRYRVTDTHVQVRSGVITRKELSARLDRVQSVDLNRPLLARLFGLSELRVEVADGGESVLRLSYLRAAAAEALRAEVLAKSAGARDRRNGEAGSGPDAAASGTAPSGTTADPAEADGQESTTRAKASRLAARAQEWGRRTGDDLTGQQVYGRFAGGTADEALLVEVPTQRLLGSIALMFAPWLVLLVASMVALGISAPLSAMLGSLIPALIALGSVFWQLTNTSWGFRAGVSADGLRVRHGLTRTQHRTVPRGRVQAVGLFRPWYFRPFGWVSVRADVAGYGSSGSEGQDSRAVLLPVGTLTEAARVVSALVPDAGTSDPWGLLNEGLDGKGKRGGSFTSSPRSARWISPIGWSRQGFHATATTLVLRTGRINRRLTLMPHARTQMVRAAQGVLARSLSLAKVRFATVAGPVRTTLPDVAAGTASTLVVDQTRRIIEANRAEAAGAAGATGEAAPTPPTPADREEDPS